MLSDDKPWLYWDACVPLSYINEYADRIPDIEGLLQRSGKDFYIVTSILSIAEVAFASSEQGHKTLDPAQEEKINKLWQVGSPIQMIELYHLIVEKAKGLMRAAIPRGWVLTPIDAIHLATADQWKVAEFHTYDLRLKKYQAITETHFPIDIPRAPQPVLALTIPPPATQSAEEAQQETSTEPKTTEVKDAKEPAPTAAEPAEPAPKNNELQAAPAHPAPVPGSDSGRVESEATGEKTNEEKG
jgi:predicted nucleic acid-binding protein